MLDLTWLLLIFGVILVQDDNWDLETFFYIEVNVYLASMNVYLWKLNGLVSDFMWPVYIW